MKDINSTLLLIAGLVLVVVGLKLTSVASGIYHIQNDGYNVTGGFIAALGGVFLGLWLTKKDIKLK